MPSNEQHRKCNDITRKDVRRQGFLHRQKRLERETADGNWSEKVIQFREGNRIGDKNLGCKYPFFIKEGQRRKESHESRRMRLHG